jgi:hypothetical protein
MHIYTFPTTLLLLTKFFPFSIETSLDFIFHHRRSQAHEQLEHLRVVWSSETSDGIPTDLTLEALVQRALLVVAGGDIVEDTGVGVLS